MHAKKTIFLWAIDFLNHFVQSVERRLWIVNKRKSFKCFVKSAKNIFCSCALFDPQSVSDIREKHNVYGQNFFKKINCKGGYDEKDYFGLNFASCVPLFLLRMRARNVAHECHWASFLWLTIISHMLLAFFFSSRIYVHRSCGREEEP